MADGELRGNASEGENASAGVDDEVGTNDGGSRTLTGLDDGFEGWPWWVKVIVVFGAARLITTTMLLVLSFIVGPDSRAGSSPDFFTFSALWDGVWYWYISATGYPSVLPVDTSGYVTENQWAFLPAYPFLVLGISSLTHVWWPIAAFFVSLGFGFGTALLLYRLFRDFLDERQALFAITLFSVAPLSFILQMAYAESMSLFLLTLALLLYRRRRYEWMFPVVLVLAITRPLALALALALLLNWIYRFVRRNSVEFPRRDRIVGAAIAIFAGLAGLAWPVAAWVVTGSISAYTDTEIAWRTGWVGHAHLSLFSAWFESARYWFGWPLGAVVVVVIVAGFAAILFSPAVRRIGIDLRIWCASYAAYLFAVFFPQSSIFRLLMPMFPLFGALAIPRSKTYRAILIAVSLILQGLWLWITWGPYQSFWTVP